MGRWGTGTLREEGPPAFLVYYFYYGRVRLTIPGSAAARPRTLPPGSGQVTERVRGRCTTFLPWPHCQLGLDANGVRLLGLLRPAPGFLHLGPRNTSTHPSSPADTLTENISSCLFTLLRSSEEKGLIQSSCDIEDPKGWASKCGLQRIGYILLSGYTCCIDVWKRLKARNVCGAKSVVYTLVVLHAYVGCSSWS